MTQDAQKTVDGLELTSVLTALREQLAQAKAHDIRFNVDKIEVELQTVVEQEGSADLGGKIKFWVLDVDASLGGKYKRSATHKIKLSLSPIDSTTESEQAAEAAKAGGAVRISGGAKRMPKE